MAKSMELIFRLRAEGQEQLKQIQSLIGGVTSETLKGNAALDAQAAAHSKAGAAIAAHQARLKDLSGGLKDVHEAGGLAQRAMTLFGDATSGLISNLLPMGLTIAGMAGGAVAAATAIYGLARSTGQLAESQKNTADRTGLTIREVGLFSTMAEEAGLNAGAFTTSMRTLSHGLSENSEEGKKAKKAMKELGMETENQFGGLKSTREIWLGLSDAIRGLSDPAQQAKLALDVLGRGGLEVLPALKSGMRETLAELERLGVGFSTDGAKSAQKFDDVMDRLGTRLAVFRREAGEVAAHFALMAIGDKEDAQRQYQDRVDLHQSYQFASGQSKILPKDILAAQDRMAPKAPTSADLGRARAARKLALEERDEQLAKEAKTAAAHLATRDKQFARLISELEEQGLNPLARLILSTTRRLGDLAAGSPLRPGQVAEATGALQGVVRRERMAHPIGYLTSDPAEGGFLGISPNGYNGFNRTGILAGASAVTANSEEVDPHINDAAVARARERVLGAMDRQAQYQERLVNLTTGPGGEVAAIQKVADIRERTALEHFRITRDQAKLEAEMDAARYGRVEALEALRQQRAQEYRTQAAGIFRAMLAGGGGITSWGKAAAGQLGESLFVNASSKLFSSAGSTLGTLGQKSGVPAWLRQGTMFADPIPESGALMMTAGQIQLKAAGMMLAAVGGGVGGGLTPGSIATAMGSFTSRAGGLAIVGGAPPSGIDLTTGQPMDTTVLSGGGVITSSGTAGRFAGLAKGVGIAGAAVAGAYGAYSGFHAGGAQGGLTGAASLVGAAGAITAMAGATGPAAPIMMGVGMALSAVAMLLGDPKKKFDAAVNNALTNNKYTPADSLDRVLDTSGFEVDYNFRGGMRSNRAPNMNLTIVAFDSQSIFDRRTEIGEAIRQELNNDGPLRAQVADVARYA